LEVYDEVTNLVDFNFKLMRSLKAFDEAQTAAEESEIIDGLKKLTVEFKNVRGQFENIYSKTRILNKPEGYILDQDHHRHPANQSITYDWQFTAELMLLKKMNNHFKTHNSWMEGTSTSLQ
jgi:hypothetical protein